MAKENNLSNMTVAPETFGLVYDKERDQLALRIGTSHFFADGACDFTPDDENTVAFGDAVTMIKRIVKSAGDMQASRFHLIPFYQYADQHGLDRLEVYRFCATQKAYAYGVRRVKTGDGNDWYIPSTLDARLIVRDSPELMEVNKEIKRYLAAHPASTVGKISQSIKRASPKVRNELARMIKEGDVLFDKPNGRYTLI